MLCSLPLTFALLPARTPPVVYPPYYPPEIQQIASWMKPDELMMSDVPWAVAWYGDRQCVWLTLDAQDGIFRHQRLFETGAGALPHAANDGWQICFRMGADAANQLGQFHRGYRDKRQSSRPAFRSTMHRRDFCPTGCFLTDRERGKRAPINSAAARLNRSAMPDHSGHFRRRLNDDQLGTRRVAAMQFRVKRPRKRLRIMRHHAHVGKIPVRGNLVCAMTKQVAGDKWRVTS